MESSQSIGKCYKELPGVWPCQPKLAGLALRYRSQPGSLSQVLHLTAGRSLQQMIGNTLIGIDPYVPHNVGGQVRQLNADTTMDMPPLGILTLKVQLNEKNRKT
ncbi:hypothetical protein [Photobacterium aquae]|uniref:hypothetical protein n=1 Tax=Photobacterium aquae TaxID=1195763 RepID=UPI0012EDA214|nr:hypothetical protein [Photobacterium aquae]